MKANAPRPRAPNATVEGSGTVYILKPLKHSKLAGAASGLPATGPPSGWLVNEASPRTVEVANVLPVSQARIVKFGVAPVPWPVMVTGTLFAKTSKVLLPRKGVVASGVFKSLVRNKPAVYA